MILPLFWTRPYSDSLRLAGNAGNSYRLRALHHQARWIRNDFIVCKARKPVCVVGKLFRQSLDRDMAVELRVASPVDFAHTALPDGRDNLVNAELRSHG